MSKKSLLVNIELLDGTVLKKCAIFNENPQHGSESFTTVEEIESAFDKIPWGKKYVAFQNELINGHVHVNNIKRYGFTEEEN